VLRTASGTVVRTSRNKCEELTMTWLLINIPLMVLFAALWMGIPAWLVLTHPDTKPALAAAPAVRTLTPRAAQRDDEAGYRRVA
jgi:hypothetical protein